MLKFTVKSIGIYRSVYKEHIHKHSCSHSIYEIMLHIFALKIFLYFSYVKHHNFPLFSMTKYINAQKQCINKKLIMCITYILHIYTMYSMHQLKTISFPIDLHRKECAHFILDLFSIVI